MDVRNNAGLSRYELIDDDRLIGIAEYYIDGDVAVFPHTEIVADRRGTGLGEVLVRAALDDVRRRGLRVGAQCWFVRDFVDANPEYAA